jgi:hypothetical protein
LICTGDEHDSCFRNGAVFAPGDPMSEADAWETSDELIISALNERVDELEREIACLQREVALWKDRCVAEQQAHEATVKWFNEQLQLEQGL